jgi:hypothetical protein
MATAPAWLLDFGKGQLAAVGERELLHIVYQPRLHRVPQADAHCDRVMAWEGGFLPVWNLAAWFKWTKTADSSGLAAVVGYADEDSGRTLRGVICIDLPPKRVNVRDEDACALSDTHWERLATSCFLYEMVRVPTLDLTAMFRAPLAAPGHPRMATRSQPRDV